MPSSPSERQDPPPEACASSEEKPPALKVQPTAPGNDDGPTSPDDMTLEEFLDDFYYNPFGPPPDEE